MISFDFTSVFRWLLHHSIFRIDIHLSAAPVQVSVQILSKYNLTIELSGEMLWTIKPPYKTAVARFMPVVIAFLSHGTSSGVQNFWANKHLNKRPGSSNLWRTLSNRARLIMWNLVASQALLFSKQITHKPDQNPL